MNPAIALLRSDSHVACALLVEVEGSGPVAPGAAMYIDADGSVEGSISGGCVESAVVAEAERVLTGEPPRLLTYGISDELAGTVGLTCGGTLHVFVSALEPEDCEAEAAALEAAEDQRPAAIAVPIEGANVGTRLAIIDDMVVGSIGTTALQRRVERDARALLDEGATAIRRYGTDGSNVGEDVALHIRIFAPPRRLLIIGATDFAAALAPIAREIGYTVTIADARARFARSRRFSRAADVIVAWPQDAIAGRGLGPRDAVLVFSHDPKFDEPALRAALKTNVGYIGALGSRRTTRDRELRLRSDGVGDSALARIHAPCGLDLGGATPAETAISILAEIIASRRQRPGVPLRTTDGSIQQRDAVEATLAETQSL
jgi:xanthine dehydrogenase accessory factor